VGRSSLILTPAAPEDRAATAAVIERVTGSAPAVVDQGVHLQTPLTRASVATEVLVALRDADLSPRTVSVDRPSMDSVFMSLTGHDSDDGDSAASAARDAPSEPESSPSLSSARSRDAKEQS
jgi:daunorubicin resistance ABC transporter ATPase subunit